MNAAVDPARKVVFTIFIYFWGLFPIKVRIQTQDFNIQLRFHSFSMFFFRCHPFVNYNFYCRVTQLEIQLSWILQALVVFSSF